MAAATTKSRKGAAKKKGSRRRPSAKSLANLRPAKKGDVRNPTGRNGLTVLQEAIDKELGKAAPEIAQVVQRLCRSGNSAMLRHLVRGAAQRVEVTGADGSEIQFRWSEGDQDAD